MSLSFRLPGGTVVSTRCSETYYRKTALVSVFGIPLWYTSNSPRTVIQVYKQFFSKSDILTLLHSERPKLYTILAFQSAIGLMFELGHA